MRKRIASKEPELKVIPIAPVDYAKVQEALDFALKTIKNASAGAIGYMVAFHFVREDGQGKRRILHSFDYHNFPNGDWGACIIAEGVEAKRAVSIAQTGATKV